MDYDSGFMTFFNEDQLDETSQIEVTYEFAPFGTQMGETWWAPHGVGPGPGGSSRVHVPVQLRSKPTLVPDVRSPPGA